MISIGQISLKAEVIDILRAIRQRTLYNGNLFLKDIREEEPAIMVTCPFHKNHNENKPSCGVFTKPYKNFNVGDFHCFACEAKGNLVTLVGQCLGVGNEEATRWLVDNFDGSKINTLSLPKIELNTKKEVKTLDNNTLNRYNYYHPYLEHRGLTKKTLDKFSVGYDAFRDAVTFPVWDEHGRLVFVTERSVTSKYFYIPKEADKPLYLLNFALAENVPMIMVTEAQIDALTAWQYGFPCCATMGTISDTQMKIINKCGIRIIVTAFDNDYYGDKFTKKFQNKVRNDILLYRFPFPSGKKDLNDLTEEEFNNGLNNLGINWRLSKENF